LVSPPLEFGNDTDAYIKWTGSIWEFGGKPIQHTGGGINIIDTGASNDAGNSHIGRNNASGYISWPENSSFYFRTLGSGSSWTAHTNRFTFESDGDFHASRYVYATYFNTSAADDVSSITKMVVETGNDGWMRHGTASVVRSFLNVESGATADQSAAEILTAIKTVDGAGSGLDADYLDGVNSTTYARHDANTTTFDGGTNTTINVVSDDNGMSFIRAYGASQGTGAIENVQRHKVGSIQLFLLWRYCIFQWTT